MEGSHRKAADTGGGVWSSPAGLGMVVEANGVGRVLGRAPDHRGSCALRLDGETWRSPVQGCAAPSLKAPHLNECLAAVVPSS